LFPVLPFFLLFSFFLSIVFFSSFFSSFIPSFFISPYSFLFLFLLSSIFPLFLSLLFPLPFLCSFSFNSLIYRYLFCKLVDRERCLTPPLAEDIMWTQLDDDPLGIYTQLGGRSSPATPPPLRALRLTSLATVQNIREMQQKIR
jgi:hypothetical protein